MIDKEASMPIKGPEFCVQAFAMVKARGGVGGWNEKEPRKNLKNSSAGDTKPVEPPSLWDLLYSRRILITQMKHDRIGTYERKSTWEWLLLLCSQNGSTVRVIICACRLPQHHFVLLSHSLIDSNYIRGRFLFWFLFWKRRDLACPRNASIGRLISMKLFNQVFFQR